MINKFLMAGIITITLPFGGGFAITTSGATPTSVVTTQGQNPTAINSGVNSNTSYNWSGYQATGGTFTGVSGTWTIPAVASATSTEADATWVGIGGVSSQDLIQAGTQAVINGSGAPQYQAWYEMLPNATQQVPLTVSPGDSISVALAQTSAGSGGSGGVSATPSEWSVSIRDNTTGQSYQTSLSYNSSLSSAEWIEEMPSDGSSFVPLDSFGTLSFTSGTAIENGGTVTIAGANAQPLTMVNRARQTLASPSALAAGGENFVVTRTSAVANAGGANGGSGSGYFVVTGRGGLGRGWRRTGVGIQGFAPRPTSTAPSSSESSSGTTGATIGGGSGYGGGNPWNQFYQIMQQFQQMRGTYLRNGFRIGR